MDLREVPALWPLRGRRVVVVACLDDPAALEALRAELAACEAELVVERAPGELSARLGRPSVTVCDRWLEVVERAPHLSPEAVLARVRLLDSSCEECPQAGVEWELSER
ncbi:MAG TPA: hypothetical protein VGJ70_24715 [Solirubrobacteraceae bacterium]